MRPLTIVNGILMGTFVAIAIGLAVVSFLYFWHGDTYADQLASEQQPLAVSTGLFTLGAGISVLAFYGQLKRTWWRWWAEGALVLHIAAVAAYFIP